MSCIFRWNRKKEKGNNMRKKGKLPRNCGFIMLYFQAVIPTNKPNAEPKRPSRPVNITPYCQHRRDHSYRLFIEWAGDKRTWAVGIFVVHRLTSQILL